MTIMNMKSATFSFILIMLTGSVNSYGEKAPEEVRKYIIGNSEIRTIHSKITSQDYELIIALPYSYTTNTTQKYPVVYFCDGYWDFALLAMIYGCQIYDKTINECFLVGFSYKGDNLDYGSLRFRDYTPVKDTYFNAGGGAAEFLKVVDNEFIPFMVKNYRVDSSWSALGGSSAGGTFVLYALMTKPSLFNAYIAISPSVTWGGNWLIGHEESFAKSHRELPVSLFMTASENEFPEYPAFVNGIKRLDETFKQRKYANFRYAFRFLDDTHHAGGKPEGFTRGMQFVFAPLLKNK